jgi:hypothetical protein
MSAISAKPAAFRARNLLGVLAFLMRYRFSAALAMGLLICNIALEMALPQVSGAALNGLQKALAHQVPFDPWWFARLFLLLAVGRACVGLAVGRVRNRLVQATLKDIRAAYFDAVQRLSFAYHDKTNTGADLARDGGHLAAAGISFRVPVSRHRHQLRAADHHGHDHADELEGGFGGDRGAGTDGGADRLLRARALPAVAQGARPARRADDGDPGEHRGRAGGEGVRARAG